MKSLRKEKAIRLVMKNGRKKWSKLGRAFILPSDELEIAIVTKKEIGGAVKRNKIRRRIKEAIRTTQYRVNNKCQLVLFASPIVDKLNNQEIKEAINEIFAL